MRSGRYTIVHAHTPKPGLLAQVAARLAGVPVVVNTIHGFYFHDRMPPRERRFYVAMERLAARCSDLILSQNEEDVDTAAARGDRANGPGPPPRQRHRPASLRSGAPRAGGAPAHPGVARDRGGRARRGLRGAPGRREGRARAAGGGPRRPRAPPARALSRRRRGGRGEGRPDPRPRPRPAWTTRGRASSPASVTTCPSCTGRWTSSPCRRTARAFPALPWRPRP